MVFSCVPLSAADIVGVEATILETVLTGQCIANCDEIVRVVEIASGVMLTAGTEGASGGMDTVAGFGVGGI